MIIKHEYNESLLPTNNKHNYKVGEFYEKKLCLQKIFGNSKEKYLEFKDKENIVLIWKTSNQNINSNIIPKRHFLKIRFKVKDIYFDHSKHCNISIAYVRRLDLKIDYKKFKSILKK